MAVSDWGLARERERERERERGGGGWRESAYPTATQVTDSAGITGGFFVAIPTQLSYISRKLPLKPSMFSGLN